MHSINQGMNPYKSVMSILCKTLAPFDDDNLIPTFGFGDVSSKDHSLISFHPEERPIHTLDNVLVAYDSCIRSINLSGPTSFAPAVYKAIEIVRNSSGRYHILVIIADGQVCQLWAHGLCGSDWFVEIH
jgi:E3 ubiquitin-protein ligase RGLG